MCRPELDAYFSSVLTFRKNDAVVDEDLMALLAEPVFDEPGSIESVRTNVRRLQGRIRRKHIERAKTFAGRVNNRLTERVYRLFRSRGRTPMMPAETPETSPAETD